MFFVSLPMQAATHKITIESPGITVRELVQEIGKQSGQSLEAGPGVAFDKLIVRFHEIPAADAMKMLSLVEAGKWVINSDKTYFNRDGAEADRRKAAENAQLVKGWTDNIAKYAERMGPAEYDAKWASSFAEKYKDLEQRWRTGDVDDFVRLEEAKYALPAERAMVRLLQLIGPQKLAENPDGFAEYATAANSLQVPLDSSAIDILKNWQSEEAVWDGVSQSKVGSKTTSRGGVSGDISQATGMLLELATNAHRAGGVVSLMAYDRNGTILKEEVSPLMIGAGKAMADERLQDQNDVAHPRWVELPPLTNWLYRARDERPKPAEVLDWWNHDTLFKQVILNPDKVDFTAQILGQQALAMADDRGENLLMPEVATLARFLPHTAFKDGKMNVNALRTRLQSSRTPVDLPNWFVVSPTDAELEFLNGQGSVDSHTLGDFVRGVAASNAIQLDDYAELIKNTDGAYGVGGDLGLIESVLEAVEPDLPGLGWLNNPPLNVAFYGTLNPNQRDEARTRSLSLSSLSMENWRPLLKNPLMLHGLLMSSSGAAGKRTIYTDPFVFFDSVSARTGTLKIVDGDGISVMVERDGFDRYYSAAEWADWLKAKNHEISTDTKFQQASRKWVKILIDFNGKASMKFQLDCDTVVGSPTHTYEGLPQEFRDRVASSGEGG